MAGEKTPMEYMVDFFQAILGYFTDFIEAIGGKAYDQYKKNKKFANINEKGQNIPKNVHDKMAYNNMDISNEYAHKWSKKDLENYEKQWNALPEEEKQKRRDAFHDENIGLIENAAEEYKAATGKKLKNVDTYFVQDRLNQPIYLKKHPELLGNKDKNDQPSDTKQQDKQNIEQKQENLQQNLGNQSSTERQKDEIQSDHLSGKPSVERENEQLGETKSQTQSFQGRRREMDPQSQKSLNKEILGLQSEKNEVDLFAGEAKQKNDPNRQRQQKQELEMQSEANKKNLFDDSPEHEKFREKVEQGAKKRKEAAKTSSAQKEMEQSQAMSNNQPMVPNK